MRTLSTSLITLVLLTCLGRSLASAQDYARTGVARDSGHFDLKLMLGLGGEVKGEGDAGPIDYSVEDDLELSYGLGIAYLHPLHRYFALGGQVSLLSWIGDEAEDADGDRNLFIDITLLPQGRYAINTDVELYVTIPLGLTVSIPGDDEITVAGATAAEIDTALGFHIGVMLGARFALSDGFGLLAELGYVAHAATHEVQAGGATEDLDLSHGQFALNVGVWF